MIIQGEAKLIASAFVKARGEMSATVIKDAKGNYGKYATLAALVEATSAHFAKNGLALVQEVSTDETGVCVESWLVHESGATMQFAPLVMPLTDKRPQAVGSIVTYARRYALGAICGLAPDDDDDGQAAQDAELQPPRQNVTRTTQKATAAPADNEDVVVTKMPSPPTDVELEVLGMWHNRTEAEAWAVSVGACVNDFEARNSMNKVIDSLGGKVTKENVAAVYLTFLRKQNAKLAQPQQAA